MNFFADQLKQLRTQQRLAMQELADAAKVSKSMISKIERGEVQPTLDIAGRLANALGKSLSEMLHEQQSDKVVLLTQPEQAIWEDAQHIKRRNISPTFSGLELEWLHVVLPAQTSIHCLPAMAKNGEKYILVIKGTFAAQIGEKNYHLEKGDSLYFIANQEHTFSNPGKSTTEYYIVIKYR